MDILLLKLIITFFLAFLVAVIIAPPSIFYMHKLKFGQEIRDEGPAWHSKKSGTPTMGGIIFIIACAVASLITSRGNKECAMLIFLSVSFGVVGFVDDFIKVKLKRNLGLTEIQKLLLQIVASVLFVWVLRGSLSDIEIIIPFTNFTFNMGYWYLPFSVLVIISAVNSVNLTDGLDGLATSVTIVVTIFFLFIAYILGEISVAVFCVALLGSTTSFLLFNKYPAKIFMGDTGSLFLGGALAGISIITGTPLFLIIAGGVFVAEAVSVILQVGFFKLTGKRIFKMAPLHHHFELSGWNENKIVSIFSLITLVLCIVGLNMI